MVSLNNLNDHQNHLLTQLSYQSHRLTEYEGLTLSQIYASLKESEKKSAFGKRLKEMIDVDLGTLVIKDTGNDSQTGFGAVAFKDYEGNTGISFRGTDGISTESVNDWLDNATSMVSGTSVQSSQAEAFYDKNKDLDGKNYLYGHSKGGQLSQSVYVNNYDEIKGIHLLNPQPLNPYSLTADQIAAMQSKKMDIVVVEGDYVWFLGTLPSYWNIRVMDNTGGSNAHTYSSDRYSNGNINPGKMPLWEYVAYFGISSLTTGIQIGGSTIGFVYNCVVRVIDFAREDMWPEIKSFIETTSNWIAEKKRELKEFGAKLSSFLTTVSNGAKDWFNKTFNAGYRYSSVNTYVRVNTDTLRHYANRLYKVNRRIADLDRRMDSLYTKVGLFDLWDLLQADALTGYSWRLTRCINYLNDTANEFDSAERSIASQL